MTVSDIPDRAAHRDVYVCQWFKGASKERGTFKEEELKIYEPPAKA